MTPADTPHPERDAIATDAAQWVLRLDRGLTPAEQDAYTQWLAADPRHRAALAEQRWGWEELDRLAGIQDSVHAVPDPDLLRPRAAPPAWRRAVFTGFALAAAAAVAAVVWWPRAAPRSVSSPSPSFALAAPIEERRLDDGSVVALNRGAVLELDYGPAQRRVVLVRGEASFVVAKDAARPFVVHANGVDVRAVGTAFNVRLDPKGVEVHVTEGRVSVAGPAPVPTPGAEPAPAPSAVLVDAGQRAVVPAVPVVAAAEPAPAPRVATLTEDEMARALAWQPRLLDFTDQTLGSIVAEFNRRNPVRLVVPEPGLGDLRLSASFRSDNVEGFVRLMESDFGMHAEWRGETEIVLRRR
jgi:transmembrane sensor